MYVLLVFYCFCFLLFVVCWFVLEIENKSKVDWLLGLFSFLVFFVFVVVGGFFFFGLYCIVLVNFICVFLVFVWGSEGMGKGVWCWFSEEIVVGLSEKVLVLINLIVVLVVLFFFFL